MKKILQAIESSPSPDKLVDLLGLQTKNEANRKGLAAEWSRAALACARIDPTPLWVAIATDWESYRVWHAIQVLGALGDAQTMARLIELGRTRILRIHWSAIQAAAKAMSVPIPPEVAEAQAALEVERGSSDFYAVLEARRPPDTADAPKAKAPAKKAKAPAAPADVPAALLATDDNAFVAAKMASVGKAFKWTRRASLSDAVHVAWCLTALDRPTARALADEIADRITFAGDYDVWSPAANAICLAAMHARRAGDEVRRQALVARLVEHPALAVMPREAFVSWIASGPKSLARGLDEKSKKWACESLASACIDSAYFLETAGAGFYYDGWIDRGALQDTLDKATSALAGRLAAR